MHLGSKPNSSIPPVPWIGGWEQSVLEGPWRGQENKPKSSFTSHERIEQGYSFQWTSVSLCRIVQATMSCEVVKLSQGSICLSRAKPTTPEWQSYLVMASLSLMKFSCMFVSKKTPNNALTPQSKIVLTRQCPSSSSFRTLSAKNNSRTLQGPFQEFFQDQKSHIDSRIL